MPATLAAQSELNRRVETVLDLIRPAIRADGGDVQLVDVLDDGTVRIRFQGACITCPSSRMTLRDLITKNLVEKVDGIRTVVSVD